MKAKEFLGRLDHKRIVDAIAAAEATTSGEIRLFIDRGTVHDDPQLYAQKKFIELGMHKTAERNAILIFVAPRAQKFAVIGDEGVHQKCGAEFWQQLVEAMRAHFKREEFTDALVEAIETAGQLLSRYFPRQPGDRNELLDTPVGN
ncbi:MAG: TPM domain-containing protein [Chthoniobacterales bacterium]